MVTHLTLLYSKESASNDKPPQSLLCSNTWEAIAVRMKLTRREFEILQLLFDGHKESQVARILEISPHTVHSHIKRMYRKLDVSDHSELIIRTFEAYLSINPR